MSNNTETHYLKQFGKRLAAIRKAKRITQEQLADAVDVHRTYIGFIEQGKRNPTIGTIHRIAKVLGVGMGELV